jgi:hemolysin activation/secretion protein
MLPVDPAHAQTDSAPPLKERPQEQQHFDIFEFRVEGNTVVDSERIERAVYPFMGEGRTIDDVESARVALEKLYHDSGYATVVADIPQQKVVGGVVVLNVTEGRISRLRVVGSRYFSQDRILATVPGVAEGVVPQLREVQKQLAEVNTSADKRVTPLLRPGKEPGTTDVDLQVDDQLPLHGSVELNNHNAPNTTATRLAASLRYANLFQREHSLGLQVQTSPQDTSQVKVFAGTYSLPAAGSTLIFNLIRSDSASFVGGGIGVFGKGNVYGVRYVTPLASNEPAAEFIQSMILGLDYKDFKQDLALSDGGSLSTPIHYAPFSLNYSGQSSDASGSTEFGAGVVLALRGLASNSQEFADKRYLALSNFAVFKANLGRTQKLPRDYSVYGHVDVQSSSQPLVSNEQYVAGGVDSVRGYLESTQAGDSALRGTLELRSPNLLPPEAWVDFLQWRAFVDAAYLRTWAPLPGTRDAFELLSTGVGISLRSKPGLTARADLAWPLRDSTFQQSHKPRLQASAAYEF